MVCVWYGTKAGLRDQRVKGGIDCPASLSKEGPHISRRLNVLTGLGNTKPTEDI